MKPINLSEKRKLVKINEILKEIEDDDLDDITPYVQSKSIMKTDSLTGISSYQLSVVYRWMEDPTRYHRNY